MPTLDDDSIEAMAAVVRRIVRREVDDLNLKLALSDDDVDRLSKLALVLQRIRMPAAKESDAPPAGGSGAEGVPSDKLMRKATE